MIKEILKENGITLTEFANKMQISRQTLDTYIKQFENSGSLKNEKMNFVFIKLFSENHISKSEFLSLLERFSTLVDRDRIQRTANLSMKKTDILTSISNCVKHDLMNDDCDINICKFIEMLINSYSGVPSMKRIAYYFLALNGRIDIETLAFEDKVFISNLFPLLQKDVSNSLTFNESKYNEFLLRAIEISKNNDKKTKDIKNKMSKEISNAVDYLIASGKNKEEISIDDVISLIKQNKDSFE